MKIVIVSSSNLDMTGAERTVLEIARYLNKQPGTEATVVVPTPGDLQNNLTKYDVATTIIPYGWAVNESNKGSTRESIDRNLVQLPQIESFLKKLLPDIVMTNVIQIPWFGYVCSMLGIPHVWFIRELIEENSTHFSLYPDLESYISFVETHSDKILVNSQFLKNYWKKLLPEQGLDVIYPIINDDILKYSKLKPKKSPNAKLKIALFGTISPMKNQLEGIKAIDILRENYTNFELLVIGRPGLPSYYSMVTEYVKSHKLENHLSFKGYVNNAYKILAECDICITPYINEPFGRATLEAMLLGCVVIASDIGGGKEIIELCGNEGFIYPNGNPKKLAELLGSLVQDPNKLHIVGNAAAKQSKKLLNNSTNLRKLYDILLKTSHLPKAKKSDWISEILIENSAISYNQGLEIKELEIKANQLDRTIEDLARKDIIISDIVNSKKWRALSAIGKITHPNK